MTVKSNLTSKIVPEFNIGEVVKARDRLWRIDRINTIEKEIKNENRKFLTYSVSSITGQPSTQLLIPEIEDVSESSLPKPEAETIGSPIYQKLLLDAMKLDLIYGTTSFISLQNSKVIPISYQMVPVLMALNLKNVRLLLADDVGLGKTIEAGLILQELLGRKRIQRVLFITPANLREQWQTILKQFFGIEAVIMSSRNRRNLEAQLLVGGNPWGYYNFVIASVDYAKQPGVREEIIQYDWDMVIIDEAHNVMRPHKGTDDPSAESYKVSYGFAKTLAESYPHVLLLTATPHNGYRDSFASLLEMIHPDLVSQEGSHDYLINKDKALNYICQRRREDVEDWIKESRFNKNPFPERDSDEIYIKPSQQFYDTIQSLNEFSEHVLKRSKDSLSKEKKLSIWTILHFHKRAISSPHALICSINNRIGEIDKKLQENYQAIENPEDLLSPQEVAQAVTDGYESDRLDEEERDERSDKLITLKTMEDLRKEKELLLEAGKKAKVLKKEDRKMNELLEGILPRRFKESPKVIIFTRYIDTLKYIKENLLEKAENSLKYEDYEIYAVHGKLASQHRQDIYNKFLKAKKGVLISTDCMAEGIDLQFSSNQVINYELTWNPNRLEQRNGRVDRFGQPKEKVFIRTLIMRGTLEMDILETLVKKAKEIKNAYGFVPGFFGDPESVIDHIMEKRKEEKKQDSQATLDKWIQFSKSVEDIISVFFSEHQVKDIMEDSFYGHNNVNLQEIEERMRLTEENIGDENTLFKFLEKAVDLYNGKIDLEEEHTETYKIKLPEDVNRDIGLIANEEYLITPNREVSTSRYDIEGINLKNPLVSGLVEKIKNEAFSVENEFYGRTAAFASSEVENIGVIFHTKIRYVVNTEPKTLMEEISPMGVDLFSGEIIDKELVERIWNSDWDNHHKNNIELKKHLKMALNLDNLGDLLDTLNESNLQALKSKRRELIKNLEQQGLATDLEGIDDIDVVGVDLVTVSLVYPKISGVGGDLDNG